MNSFVHQTSSIGKQLGFQKLQKSFRLWRNRSKLMNNQRRSTIGSRSIAGYTARW